MKKVEISISQFADFLESTDSEKKRIVLGQMNLNKDIPFYYQKARAEIRKSVLFKGSQVSVNMAITELTERPTDTSWKKTNKTISIEALKKWKMMNLPATILDNDLKLVRTTAKHLPFYDVQIKVSPDGIFRLETNGVKYIGAFIIHLSKGKKFNHRQSALVTQLLNQFLSNFVAQEDEIVDPQLCMCIDPFSGTIVTSSNKITYDMLQFKDVCREIQKIWEIETLKAINVA